MNPSTQPDAIAIGLTDLGTLAKVAMLRLPLRAPETERCASVAALLDAEADLARALAAHVHSTRVNFCGTHGAGSLTDDTEALGLALRRFSADVRAFAARYGHLLEPVLPPMKLESETDTPLAPV